ncbi:MAG: RDD family protein [Pseudomonadota bacterium]
MTDQSWHIPDPERQSEFYADVPMKRLLAWIVDTGVILAISTLIVLATFFVSLFIWPLLLLGVGLAYRTVTLARGSATWGMQLMAIEFRTLQGERLSPATAFLHSLGLTISFSIPVLQIISVVLMLTGERGQGLSDLALGTVALNRRAAA